MAVIKSEQWPPLPPLEEARADLAAEADTCHNWYPALSRCACGLRLPNAQHWTDHVTSVGITPLPALPIVDRL